MTPKEITIFYNEDQEMMKISIPKGATRAGKKKEEVLFEGNDWDFPRDPEGLKEFLTDLFKECDISIKVTKKKYKGAE
jgi:hypothetical protein